MNGKIHIVHLYPKEMNIYGDTGNTLILQKRLEWRGYEVKVSRVGMSQKIPGDVDIIIGGGGQDAGQSVVQDDLQKKAKQLDMLAKEGVVMLMVCGLYQLFGRQFVTSDGEEIKGIGLLPLETVAGPARLIGNTIYETEWGQIVGYENHSGLTYLSDTKYAFGHVARGAGNNGKDKTEGCRVHNVFGTYSHGPVLGKNPDFADELIRLAVRRRHSDEELKELDNTLELRAAEIAKKRPR